MSRREEYVKVERERISELIESIDNLFILGLIYRTIVNVTAGTKYETNANKHG